MKLKLQLLSQRDARWSRKTLGFGTGTIGTYGCLLTCHCMLLNYYGYKFTPDELNEKYKSSGVFEQGNLINFFAAANCFDNIVADEHYNCYDFPCDLEKIDKYLAEGKPVIALVDFEPKAGLQTHFIIIHGKEDGSYLTIDPWDGTEQWFQARYGDDPAKYIFGLRLYSGPVPIGGETIESLIEKNTELAKSLATEIESNAELRRTIVRLQGELAKQDKAMQGLTEENTKLVIDNEKRKIKIGDLEKGITSRDETISGLRNKLKASKIQLIKQTPFLEILKIKLMRGGENK